MLILLIMSQLTFILSQMECQMTAEITNSVNFEIVETARADEETSEYELLEETSEYELLRFQNIERNKTHLALLGFGPT